VSARLTGRSDLNSFMVQFPEKLLPNILRPALRAGAEEFAEGAREACRSEAVRASIKVTTRMANGTLTATIAPQGKAVSLAWWLEFGTDPHFITVDGDQRDGRTVRRINKAENHGSLMIGGKFVGSTVYHPGARPYPFMRPSADTRRGAAIAAISATISMRLSKAGLSAPVASEADA